MKKSWSWGNYPLAEHETITPEWGNEPIDFSSGSFLPHGQGRSYGDVPINDHGTLIKTQWLNHIIHFDKELGQIHCEAGTTFLDILQVIVPQGWFLPVTPGTQFISIGGAVANDIHGKNHHGAGTFGCHVLGFGLLKSTQEQYWCSPQEHKELFAATIGGLGLTGLITSVKIQLMPIKSAGIDTHVETFENLEQGLELFEHHSESTYTVAWIDCLAQSTKLGRGIFSSGEHSARCPPSSILTLKKTVPFNLPSFTLNKWTVSAFNELYFRNGKRTAGKTRTHYKPFFYPLDGVQSWNRIYGNKGFFQHQSVIPFGNNNEGQTAIKHMLKRISNSGNASFLAVLKVLGDKRSPGMLSFPSKGITLALDFPNKGKSTLTLLEALDDIVREHCGKIYPAKDARMSGSDFQAQYPLWQEFNQYIDPKFSSSFWRRVTAHKQ